MFQIISKADSETTQIEFVKQVAEKLDIDPNAAIRDYRRFATNQAAAKRPKQTEKGVQNEPIARKTVHTVERDLLGLCLNEEEIGYRIAQIIDEQWIDTSSLEGELLNLVLNAFLHDMWNGPDSLNDQLDKTELKSLAIDLIFQKPEYDNPERLAEEAIKKLVTKFADQKIKKIKLEIAQKQSEQDSALSSLFDEIVKLQNIKGNPPQLE